MKVARGIVIAALICVGAGQQAFGQDQSTNSAAKKPAPIASPWSASLTSYVWLAGMSGDVGVRNLPSAHVDAGFSDVFDKLDWTPPPIMLVGEIRYDRFALVTDLVYVGFEDSATGHGPLRVKADATLENIIWTFGGTYRAIKTDRFLVDLEVGGRLWSVSSDLQLNGPRRSFHFSDNTTWVDPIIGVAGQVQLGYGFAIHAEADVGGFGAAADLDWQVIGTLQYEVATSVMLQAGYRYLAIDYNRDGFKMDAALHGPIIGATVRF
jgi:hypothetical protein